MEACHKWDHHRLGALPGLIESDMLRYLRKSEANRAAGEDLLHRLSALATPELMALATYRTSHYLHVKGWVRLARGLAAANRMLHRLTIDPGSCIGPGLHIPHPAAVHFAGIAGRHLTLYAHAVCSGLPPTGSDWRPGTPLLGDHVTVGGNAAVMGPVRVGDGVRIAFSQRVIEDVPAGAMVVSRQVRVKYDRVVAE